MSVKAEHEFPIPDYFIENWGKVSKDLWAFYFSQAEKFLVETNKTAETITNRCYVLLGICLTILTTALGYMISHSMTSEAEQVFLISCFLLVVVVAFALYRLYLALEPYQIEVPGTEPRIFLNDGFIEGFEEAEQLKNYLLTEVLSYQERINSNLDTNRTRMDNFNSALITIAISPFCLLAGWILKSLWAVLS